MLLDRVSLKNEAKGILRGARVSPYLFTLLFMVICYLINRSGVSGGIEKFNKVGMPALFVILIVLLARTITLDGVDTRELTRSGLRRQFGMVLQDAWLFEGTIAEIRTAVVDGNSIYFLRFDGESAFSVRMSAAEVAYAPLLNVGDRVCVYYRDGYVTENWIEASDVELLDGSAQSAPPVETSVSTEDSADPVENAQEMP